MSGSSGMASGVRGDEPREIMMRRLWLALLAALALAFSTGAVTQVVGTCALTTHSERIGGGTIGYNRAGAGPAVLLVHGLFADKEQWSTLACLLVEAGYTAIALDLPGYGKSDG